MFGLQAARVACSADRRWREDDRKANEDGKLLAWDEEAGVEVEMLMPEGADLCAAVGEDAMLLGKDEYLLLKTEVVELRENDERQLQALTTSVSGDEERGEPSSTGGSSHHHHELPQEYHPALAQSRSGKVPRTALYDQAGREFALSFADKP